MLFRAFFENIRGEHSGAPQRSLQWDIYVHYLAFFENIRGEHSGDPQGSLQWDIYVHYLANVQRIKGPEYKLMYREHKENIHNQGVYSLDIHYLISHYVLRLFTGRSLRTYVENFQGTFVERSFRTYE